MELHLGIYLIFLVTKLVNSESSKSGYYFEDNNNKERFDDNKVLTIFKPSKLLLLLTQPHNSQLEQLKDLYTIKNNNKNVLMNKSKDRNGLIKYEEKLPGRVDLNEWINYLSKNKNRRNLTFNPWGGKRDSNSFKPDPKIRRPVRIPFNSWGGKRDNEHFKYNKQNEETSKRDEFKGIKKPFNSWGGKRSFKPFYYKQYTFLNSPEFNQTVESSSTDQYLIKNNDEDDYNDYDSDDKVERNKEMMPTNLKIHDDNDEIII